MLRAYDTDVESAFRICTGKIEKYTKQNLNNPYHVNLACIEGCKSIRGQIKCTGICK